MKIIPCLCLLWMGILLFPGQVFANATPGLSSIGSLIVLLLAMVILTAVGGGYTISKKIRVEKKGRLFGGPLPTIVVTLTVLSALSTVGLLIIATLVAAVLILYRAFKMATLSKAARGQEKALSSLSKMLKSPIKKLFPAVSSAEKANQQESFNFDSHFITSVLKGTNPWRLSLASWLLIVATIILVPATISLGVQSSAYTITVNRSHKIVKILRQYAAEEIRIRKDSTVETRKEELREIHDRFLGSISDRYSHECIIDEQLTGQNFTIFMVPKYADIIWPGPAISFRADESGKIRAVKVYSPGTRCPQDAKVITDVREPEKDYYPLFDL